MKTVHIWMPDRRSLCDRRAQLHNRVTDEMTDDEFDQLMEETQPAPACGSCLLLAEHLRAHAAVIYRMQGATVHPPKPIDGWRELRGTRWAREIDLPKFLANPELEDQLRYDRITDGIAPHRLQEWIDMERAAAERATTELISWREEQRAAQPPRDSNSHASEPPGHPPAGAKGTESPESASD
ncbi:hypothetical protein AAHS21_31410 [Mycobacterium sp. 050272]|uniref:hypothetical protein n=1 Tax=Mycobacterium sp. 050272 TaxID=3142488 RepID=UPI00318BA361